VAGKAGTPDVAPADSVEAAATDLAATHPGAPARVLICGSLYLAGHVLGTIKASRDRPGQI